MEKRTISLWGYKTASGCPKFEWNLDLKRRAEEVRGNGENVRCVGRPKATGRASYGVLLGSPNNNNLKNHRTSNKPPGRPRSHAKRTWLSLVMRLKIALKRAKNKTRMETKMTDKLHLDEFQAYLLAEDRSPVTIAGYVGDVRLFAQWYEKQYKEPLTPKILTNDAVRGYKQYLLDQLPKAKDDQPPAGCPGCLCPLAGAGWICQECVATRCRV